MSSIIIGISQGDRFGSDSTSGVAGVPSLILWLAIDIQFTQGLNKFYERTERWEAFAETLQKLAELFAVS